MRLNSDKQMIKGPLILLIIILPTLSQSQIPLEYGKYNPGFQWSSIIDETRHFQDGLARKLQLGIWYPVRKNGQPFKVEEYLKGYDVKFSPETEGSTKPFFGFVKALQADSTKVVAMTSQFAKATQNAMFAKGKFPLIVYMASFNGSLTENYLLCELLASHGYVVVCMPGWGADSPQMKLDQQSLQAQLDDASLVLKTFLTKSYVDKDKIITCGFSIGAFAAIRLASLNPVVSKIITLDGTHSYRYDMLNSPTQSFALSTHQKFLQFNQRPLLRLKLDTTFYHQTDISAIYTRFKNLDHTDFSSVYMMLNMATGPDEYSARQLRTYPAYIPIDTKVRDYQAMTQMLLSFLNIRPTSGNMIQTSKDWKHKYFDLCTEIKAK